MCRLLIFLSMCISMYCFGGNSFDCDSLSEKYQTVKLKRYDKAPSFYVISQNYVIFFKEEDIKKYFSYHKNSSISDRFKTTILANFPLKQNLDLYIDLISGSILLPKEYEFLTADLLEAGNAAVLPISDIWGGNKSAIAELKLFKVKDSISGSRYFCDAKNLGIFYIMDYIS